MKKERRLIQSDNVHICWKQFVDRHPLLGVGGYLVGPLLVYNRRDLWPKQQTKPHTTGA